VTKVRVACRAFAIVGLFGFIIAAVATGDWYWLIAAVGSVVLGAGVEGALEKK
jgi:hypothetical protein